MDTLRIVHSTDEFGSRAFLVTFVLIVFGIVVFGFCMALYLGYREVKYPQPPKKVIPTPITDRFFLFWIGVFFSFLVFSSFIGGDAINGHTEGGRYFVRSQGNITQVSRATWNASLLHGYFTIFSLFALVLFKSIETRIRKQSEKH